MMDAATPLPTGGCNFCDLAQGVALRCGCQKFWLRRRRRKRAKGSNKGKELSRINGGRPGSPPANDDTDSDEDEEDCRCGHHACFHSFESPVSVRTQSTGRYSLQISDTETSLRLDRSGTNLAASGFSITSGTTTERDYSTAEPSPSVVAARNIRSHPYQPSHLSSRSRSSASKSTTTNRGESRNDITQGLQLMLENFLERLNPQGLQSAIECFLEKLNPQPSTAVSASTIVSQPSPEHAEINTKLSKLLDHIQELNQSSRSHHERLETVETFGSILEEIRDKQDLTEDRANEIEEKVLSFEARLNDQLAPLETLLKSHSEKRKPETDPSTRSHKRRKTDPSPTTPSKTSFTSSSTSSSTPRSDGTTSRLLGVVEHLESRITDLEAVAPPSIARPWLIEAVLLPPAPLRGIWTDAAGTAGGYESSNPHSVSTLGTQHRPRTGPLPRSFAAGSRLYRRLQSRGFVKTLMVVGPTAHDVAAAVEAGFGALLEWCVAFYAGRTSPGGEGGWQPLRKVHKQTNLEFLKPGEMAESNWTVEFLKGSCIMRGRRRVLYITPVLGVHPPPYEGVGWADIKALPAVEDGEGEECWGWKETLDEPLRAEVEVETASWSSFGPFQMEDGVRRDSPGAVGETPEGEVVAPLSPPVSLMRRRKLGSSLEGVKGGGVQRRVRRQSPVVGIEGLTPAATATATARSSSYPPSLRALSGSLRLGGSLELSPGTMGWFVEHPLEVVGEGESRVVLEEEGDEGEVVEEEEEETEQATEGDGGYGSLSA